MKDKVLLIIIAVLWLAAPFEARAQKVTIGTNALEWADFASANVEVGLGLSQHYSMEAGGECSPWKFKTSKGYDIWHQRQTAFLGIRWWPWYVFSGWSVGAKVQYGRSSTTGVWRAALEECRSIGGGVSLRYTIMLSKHFNLDLGAGFWGGRHLKYTVYDCPRCMDVRESGPRCFIGLDDVRVSINFVL